jgi:hypothetical protein
VNGAGYIIASWALVGGSLAIYAIRLLQRGRTLTRRVPAQRRRWMSSPGDRT